VEGLRGFPASLSPANVPVAAVLRFPNVFRATLGGAKAKTPRAKLHRSLKLLLEKRPCGPGLRVKRSRRPDSFPFLCDSIERSEKGFRVWKNYFPFGVCFLKL